jgi:hypothetical protein
MDVSLGDLKINWDSKSKDEIDAAREQFNSMKKKGYLAYAVKRDGSPGKQITEFDPDLELIIMSPKLVGG